MVETVLGNTLAFLSQLGIYDVILPFLLVFTIVFAILEKTKIFGVEEVDGQKITRKNMNAMTAFVMGFFVVASAKLVALINQIASQAFLLLLLIVLFMMLVGVMSKEGEFEISGRWRTGVMVVAGLALVFIFLNAVGWLDKIYSFLSGSWDSNAVSAVVLIVFIGLIMWWITGSKNSSSSKAAKNS